LANFTTQTDFIAYNTIDKIIAGSIQDGTGIETVRETEAPGVITINVVPNTTHQLTTVQGEGVSSVPARSILNFTATGSASVSVTDDPTEGGRAHINIDASAGANPNAKYVLNAAGDGSPQLLSSLTTGIMKVTTTTGLVSTAVANTDYQAPSAVLTSIAAITPATGAMLVGNDGVYDDIIPGEDGKVWTSRGPGIQPAWEIVPGAGSAIVKTSNDTFVDNTTFITNLGSQLTFTMPTLPNCQTGKYYAIEGFGSGGWTIAQRAGQTIKVGTISTTTGAGGSITSTLPTDSIIIWCVTSDGATTAEFVARPTSGQVSVV
jgi:hypothetical protein